MAIKIGIDLDKTLFDCNSIVYHFFNKFNFNKEGSLKHHEINQKAIYKCSLLNKVCRFFNPKNYFTFPDACEVLQQLSDSGFEVYLVSNRPNIRPIISMTMQTLRDAGIKYDKLILGCNNKAEFAKAENLSYFIDNNEDICKLITKKSKIETICFAPKVKKREPKLLLKGIHRLSSWKKIGNYFQVETQKLRENKEETMIGTLAKVK